MKLRKQASTSYPITFLMVDSADHITGKTGLTPVVTISKNGAAFEAPAGAVTEVGNGWYALAGDAADRDTLGDLLIHAAAAGADPVDDRYLVVPWDPFDTNSLGLVYVNTMPARILATAVAVYAGTPGTVGYLLSLLAGLDFTAVNLVATSNAGEITIKRTLTLAAVVSGLTIPADWTACYWTVKRSVDDADADAMVQILVSNPGDPDDGVQVLMGTALEDESDGSLVVNQALGTVTIALGDASTALLDDAVELVWDVKVHSPSGKTQPGTGTAIITTAVTRA